MAPTLIMLGRTGVGKSSLVNCAFGGQVAATHPFDACTKVVSHYLTRTPWGDIELVDTPGLSESEDVAVDVSYLNAIRFHAYGSRRFLYVTPLHEPRFRPDEQRTIRLLTEWLGLHMWNDAVLVFTFAASVAPARYAETVRHKCDEIVGFISRITGGVAPMPASWVLDNVVRNWHERLAGHPVQGGFSDLRQALAGAQPGGPR